jgi:hypothetical protein
MAKLFLLYLIFGREITNAKKTLITLICLLRPRRLLQRAEQLENLVKGEDNSKNEINTIQYRA